MVIPLFIYTFVADYQIIILNEMGIGLVPCHTSFSWLLTFFKGGLHSLTKLYVSLQSKTCASCGRVYCVCPVLYNYITSNKNDYT